MAKLLSLPNGYGTSPYRPLWIGLLVICVFAVIFWMKDPFIPSDDEHPPKKSRNPLPLFSFMYSIDTFIPIIDVTKVKDWGWEVSSPCRWITVTERLLGLMVFYSAAYSLTYYVL